MLPSCSYRDDSRKRRRGPVVNFTKKITNHSYAKFSAHKKLESQNVIKEKLRKTLGYVKSAHKILVKLLPEEHLCK